MQNAVFSSSDEPAEPSHGEQSLPPSISLSPVEVRGSTSIGNFLRSSLLDFAVSLLVLPAEVVEDGPLPIYFLDETIAFGLDSAALAIFLHLGLPMLYNACKI
jgi:hypothetical protein